MVSLQSNKILTLVLTFLPGLGIIVENGAERLQEAESVNDSQEVVWWAHQSYHTYEVTVVETPSSRPI